MSLFFETVPPAAAAAATPVRAAWVSKFGDSITMSYAVYKQQLVTVSVTGTIGVLSMLCMLCQSEIKRYLAAQHPHEASSQTQLSATSHSLAFIHACHAPQANQTTLRLEINSLSACRCCVAVQDAGGRMPAPADVVAAGGVASTVGSNTNYGFNASVPSQKQGFFSLLQEVMRWALRAPCF
jgi:hypothetical protein